MSYVLELPVWIDSLEESLIKHGFLKKLEDDENDWVQSFVNRMIDSCHEFDVKGQKFMLKKGSINPSKQTKFLQPKIDMSQTTQGTFGKEMKLVDIAENLDRLIAESERM